MGVGEAGQLRGDEEVAAERDLQSPCDTGPVDGPDNRLAHAADRPPGVGRRQRAAEGGDLLHVGSGAERRIGPGEDDNVDVVVLVDLGAQLLQPLPHGHGQRVASRRTVEHHRQHTVGTDLQQVGHHRQRWSNR